MEVNVTYRVWKGPLRRGEENEVGTEQMAIWGRSISEGECGARKPCSIFEKQQEGQWGGTKHGGVMGSKVGQAASEARAHAFILSEMEAMGGSSAGRDA